jgi:hypothetical protein
MRMIPISALGVSIACLLSVGCSRRNVQRPQVKAEDAVPTRPSPPTMQPVPAQPIEGQQVRPAELTPQSLAAVYAVRRSTQSSSCDGTVVGEVLNTIPRR